MNTKFIAFCVWFWVLSVQGSPEQYSLGFVDWMNQLPPNAPPFMSVAVGTHSVALLAKDAINNGLFPDILPNTRLELDIKIDGGNPAVSIEALIDLSKSNHTFVVGFPLSDIAKVSGVVGNVYGVAQLGSSTSSSSLSNKFKFPYFSRLSPGSEHYAAAITDSILHYSAIQGSGWDHVAVLAVTHESTLSLASDFIHNAPSQITISTFQQFIQDEIDVSVEMAEIRKSGSRVIVALVRNEYPLVVDTANEFGLIGENFVWFVSNAVVSVAFAEPSELYRGTIGVNVHIPKSVELQQLTELWNSADPKVYPAAGTPLTPFHLVAFDMILTAARAIDAVDAMGLLDGETKVPPGIWFDVIQEIQFDGSSGPISFDRFGDRLTPYEIVFYSPETNNWIPSAIWSTEEGYDVINDIIWFSNTTKLPDLDIRDPFDYWSCSDKEKRKDKTGKEISLHSPGSSGFDDIDIVYYCDKFIDCPNLSDESSGNCSSNFLIIFIVFGLITAVLILFCLLLIGFVLVVGVFLKYRRLRRASPTFLILLLISIIIGYISIFSWFGKPHPVSCAFQPWLLGLSSLSMVAALTVKNFRIYRIFKFPMKKLQITDFELILMWTGIMIPAVLILIFWTILSSPTAAMQERDGEEHFVCTTGGFTGEPGGIIFFFIFVAYGAVVLFLGAIVSFLNRGTPCDFNETKLLTISIYNLGFLSVVIIPVFLVVQPLNPFIAWILRTVAVLYAFSATLTLQFIPKLWGIILTDKGANVKQFKSKLSSGTTTTTSATSRPI